MKTYDLSYPAHLYCMAKLFHLNPKDYKKARVLELGSKSAGNIIPFAYYCKEAQVIGIEASAEKIAIGQNIIDTLQLKNIQLLQCSIDNLPSDLGLFDYIICHDAYSQLSESLRDTLIRVTQAHLAPEGIAYLGYKTLPCWNMLRGLRDMMLYHIEYIPNKEEKIQQARALLTFIFEGIGNENSTYAKFLKQEIQLIAQQSDEEFYQEYLLPEHYACYFYEFIATANANGLAYVGDAYLPMMYPGNLPDYFKEQIENIKDSVQVGQYMDFIRNQRLRSTLLCHEGKVINRDITIKDIKPFYIAYDGLYHSHELHDLSAQETLEFETKSGSIKLKLSDNLSKALMLILYNALGKPMSYAALVEQAVEKTGSSVAQIEQVLSQELNLVRLLFAGFIKIYPDAAHYTTEISAYPKANALIRHMAKIGDLVPNGRHESYKLSQTERMVLQKLTGEKTKDQILDMMATMVSKLIENKELSLKDQEGIIVTQPEAIAECVTKMSERWLKNLAKQAFFSEGLTD